MKNELIKVTTNENGQKLVSVRELYLGLGMDKKNCSKWLDKNIVNNDFFKENVDWVIVLKTTTEKGGRPTTDYAINLEFAKHLAMMSRTKKSHEYRNYFIECEKIAQNSLNTFEQRKAIALLDIYNGGSKAIEGAKVLAELETAPLKAKIEEDEPLVELAKKRLDSNGLISITDATKTFELKRGRITKWAKNTGYLHKSSTEVNKLGEEYFRVYDAKGFRCIGINEDGLKLINEHLEEIKAS